MLAAFVLGLVPYAFADSDPEQAPKDIKSMTAAELEKAGDASRMNKDYPEAVRYFQEAIKRDNKNASFQNKLGLSLLSVGNANAARRAFEKAVQLNPRYASAHNNLGVIYFRQKNLGNAVKQFRKAIAADETQAALHLNLGVTLFNQRKFEAAMKEYARAIELDPEVLERSSRTGITAEITSPEDRARFYFELAKIHAKRGNFEECLRCLRISKENGHRRLADVYRDEQFSYLWDDERLHEIVAPPVKK
jgi:tetratricopeptide (TPR) repeat protein